MDHNRIGLGNGIGFTTIIDSKFKTSSLSINFITELSENTDALNTLGMGVLTMSSSRYKTYGELCEKLSSLYGAGLGSVAQKKGDAQILGMKASWLSNRYALEGEDIRGEMLELIRDCLFSPNAENGAFDEDSFALVKKDLLDRISSELNNKRGYAISQAAKTAFRGEPAENTGYGSRESALAADSAAAYKAYEELLRTAQVEIYYVSPEKDDSFAEMFRECFGNIEREPKIVSIKNHSPIKPQPETKSEEFDVNQCKTVMVFKTDSDDIYALKMLSVIYGETPFSKLFLNVREKLSLCYYCASRSLAAKGAFIVDSGVERDKIDTARNEIFAQLDEIKNGNITDEEIESSLLVLNNAVLQIGDTPSSYISWFFECFCDGRILTPQEHYQEFCSVTKERITEAARSLQLDTVYLMLNKEEAE